jgi:hypothetical protein
MYAGCMYVREMYVWMVRCSDDEDMRMREQKEAEPRGGGIR